MSNILYKYYKRRADTLLSELDKAKTSFDITDIHNFRKEIKKIRSLNKLFRYISTKGSDNSGFKGHFNVLKELFDYTGQIRELQVNLVNIEKYKQTSTGLRSYKNSLKAKEKVLIDGLETITDAFNKQKFEDIALEIKKHFKDVSEKKAANRSTSYIINEIKRISKILKKASAIKKYHDVRIELKQLAAISELLYFIRKDRKIKIFITAIKKTESKLGNWHDRIIMRDSIESFVNKRPKNTEHSPQTIELKNLIVRINNTNKQKAQSFDPDIIAAIKLFPL